MLVVTRRLGECIHIGQDIRVMVVRIDGGQVRIGIEAPDDVQVLREELLPPRGEKEEGDDAVQQ